MTPWLSSPDGIRPPWARLRVLVVAGLSERVFRVGDELPLRLWGFARGLSRAEYGDSGRIHKERLLRLFCDEVGIVNRRTAHKLLNHSPQFFRLSADGQWVELVSVKNLCLYYNVYATGTFWASIGHVRKLAQWRALCTYTSYAIRRYKRGQQIKSIVIHRDGKSGHDKRDTAIYREATGSEPKPNMPVSRGKILARTGAARRSQQRYAKLVPLRVEANALDSALRPIEPSAMDDPRGWYRQFIITDSGERVAVKMRRHLPNAYYLDFVMETPYVLKKIRKAIDRHRGLENKPSSGCGSLKEARFRLVDNQDGRQIHREYARIGYRTPTYLRDPEEPRRDSPGSALLWNGLQREAPMGGILRL